MGTYGCEETLAPCPNRIQSEDTIGYRLRSEIRLIVENKPADCIKGVAFGDDIRGPNDTQSVPACRDDMIVVEPNICGSITHIESVAPYRTDCATRNLKAV